MFYVLFLISCNFSLIYFVIFYKQNTGFVVFLFVLYSIILLFCTLFDKIYPAEIQVDSEAASRSGETFRSGGDFRSRGDFRSGDDFRSRGDFHSGGDFRSRGMKSEKQLSYLIKTLFITQPRSFSICFWRLCYAEFQ